MTEHRFEDHRAHLRGVAYRMLGSLSEAEDAVQEAWLRLERAAPNDIANLRGWLTTVVARVCLDMLRSRTSRREEPLEPRVAAAAATAPDAEQELMMADSIGLAVLVVLDRLEPAERLAFVLHDMFAVPFDEIAGIVGRTAEAARQLASRARRRVQGAEPPQGELVEQRRLVEAFIAALRAGDVEGLIAVLDPDVAVTVAGDAGGKRELRGARTWAQGAVQFGKAMQHATAALVDGQVGLVLAPKGQVQRVLRMWFADGRITRAEVISEQAELDALEISPLA
ncbi:MAG TPA: sigma-70 family RNA polymerase sigma factor [Kofleriaceae bacterium]